MGSIFLRGLVVGIGVLVALAGDVAEGRETRSGLRVGAPVVTVPADWPDQLSLVRTDANGRIFAGTGQHVASFTREGMLISRWDVPDDVRPSTEVVLDVSPAGEVFAAELGGSTVYRHAADGRLLDSWNGDGASRLAQVTAIAFDPRGSLVISDGEYRADRPIAQKRFSPDGRFLGRVLGPTQQTTIGPSGRRWTVLSAAVWGFLASGRLFQILGDECTLGGGEREPCATGIGTFGGAPPDDLSAGPDGGLATVGLTTAGLDRVQLFRASGQVVFACDRAAGSARVVTADFDGPSHLVLGAGRRIYRAAIVPTAAPDCRRTPLAVSGVRVDKRRVLRYRLSARAAVDVRLWRVSNGRVVDMVNRDGPRQRGANRVTIRRCDHGRCLGRGRWYVSVRATDRRQNRADSPALDSVRF